MAQIPTKMCDGLNDQIQKEIASAYLYLAMSSFCESINFKGASSWLRIQWEEELAHGLKIVDHLNDREGTVVFKAIEPPGAGFTSLLDVFEKVLEHERAVSVTVNSLYGLAAQEGDFAAQAFLQWFVAEQVEEEATAKEIVDNLRLAGEDGSTLLMIDRELGARQSGGGGMTAGGNAK